MEGSMLPILKVAAEEASRQGLPLDKYTVSVSDEGESVGVLFRAPERTDPKPLVIRFGGGNPPSYEILIRKADRKILVSAYSK
jgi:hypothetical protein